MKNPNLFVRSSQFGLLSKQVIRNFSTNYENSSTYIKPEIIYENADTQKSLVFKDNKGKSGIYRWTNNLNGDSYIGSGVDLNKRLYHYYSLKLMQLYVEKRKSYIYSALIKHGYSNFTLEIMEYCDKDKVIEREQYYLNILKPKYNLLKTAGSRYGFEHSEFTREKMSLSQKGHKGSFNQPNAKILMVTDLETNSSTYYDSINLAAKALNCGDSSILKNLKSKTGKAYKGRCVFKLL
uniref:GIY-YIG endonuclease n=1 Tax=Sclerotinia borealis TaxID=77105 RepID=A0A088CB10_9HELO|nr:GIY-YIG endonuclease [Sclerotinia borealis]AHX82998.1 GIY-YIG endonuclease [Sclerotinia borealis]